jgi:hypothetical protein
MRPHWRSPKHWFEPHPHTHVALDDAIEQGALFCNMLAENRGTSQRAERLDHAL